MLGNSRRGHPNFVVWKGGVAQPAAEIHYLLRLDFVRCSMTSMTLSGLSEIESMPDSTKTQTDPLCQQAPAAKRGSQSANPKKDSNRTTWNTQQDGRL